MKTIGKEEYATEQRAMLELVPFRGVRTVYSRIGDMFAWPCNAG